MASAGREEKQITIEKGQHHDKVPAITGVIFRKETKKLLFIGVRNKFCSVCAKDSEKEHDCFKNWDGASSSMECKLIIEGFRKATAWSQVH